MITFTIIIVYKFIVNSNFDWINRCYDLPWRRCPYLEGFIDRLKLLRKKYNLSQKDFAKLIGSSQGNVGDWERGRSLPGAIAISRIVKQFNISADWLFFGMNEQDNQNNVESLIPLISKLNKDEIENVKKYTKFLIWLRNEKTEKNKQ